MMSKESMSSDIDINEKNVVGLLAAPAIAADKGDFDFGIEEITFTGSDESGSDSDGDKLIASSEGEESASSLPDASDHTDRNEESSGTENLVSHSELDSGNDSEAGDRLFQKLLEELVVVDASVFVDSVEIKVLSSTVNHNPIAWTEMLEMLEKILTESTNLNNEITLNDLWTHLGQLFLEQYGWVAVWTRPAETPGQLQMSLVLVESVEFNQGVQVNCRHVIKAGKEYVPINDIELEIEVTQLYPLKEQVNVLNTESMGKFIDMFRIFKSLWLPWDPIEAERFLLETFERRKELLYVEMPSMPLYMQYELARAMEGGRQLNQQLNIVLKKLEQSLNEDIEKSSKFNSINIQFQIQDFEFIFNRIQNPIWRQMQFASVAAWATPMSRVVVTKDLISEKLIVVLKGYVSTAESLVNFGRLVKKRFGQLSPFRLMGDLEEAVTKCKPGSTIAVGPGRHYLKQIGNLEAGGSLIGLDTDDRPTIETKETGDYWLVFKIQDDKAVLQDLNLKITPMTSVIPWGSVPKGTTHFPSGILLNQGTLHLKNVYIKGVAQDPGSPSQKCAIGIRTLQGTNFIGNKLILKSFCTSVRLGGNSSGKICESYIHSCEVGIHREPSTILKISLTRIEAEMCQITVDESPVPPLK